VISGTWGINALVSNVPSEKQKFLQTTRYVNGEAYLFIESAPTSSVNLEWLLKNVFRDVVYEEANQIVSQFGPEDVSLMYLPYLHGDLRGIHNSGCFFGLSANDNRETIIRAVYEGVAYGHKRQIEKLVDSGHTFDKLIFTGGASNSDVWCQIFADILGQDVYVPMVSNSGILGAAMMASVACGEYSDYVTACRSMMGQYKTYHPNREATEIYLKKYKQFCQL